MAEVKGDKAKRILRFYWGAALRYPALVSLIGIILPIAAFISNILPPIILANVINRLSEQDFVAGEPIQSFGSQLLLYAILVLFSGLVIWRILDVIVWKLEGRVQKDLADKVFSHLMIQSSDFHANHFGGSLVSQTNKLLTSYVRIADTTFFGLMPLLISIFGAAVVLSGSSPLFSVAILIFSFTYIVVAFWVSRPVRKASADHASQESKQTGYLADAITNVMAIKSFAKTQEENEAFAKVTNQTHKNLKKLMKAHQYQMLYFSGMTSAINASSLFLAVISVVSFNANIGTAFLIFNYTANIVAQLFQFSNQALRNYNRAIGDASDMVDILDTEPEVKDIKNPEILNIADGEIQIKNMHFQHKGADSAIFSGLNLTIKPGEKIGLIGHSGSGKSTLVKLLLRFADIDAGEISIDGQNTAKITQENLRSFISYVPQEPLLFHRSIYENISYGNSKAGKENIIKASKNAHADEFISELPNKYETLVGERGVKLSGGQRQRVAIARAMVKDAPILLLDEATSALDSESEQLIQDALWKLMEGKTAIVIAHRLSTIQKMDRIIVLDNGKIVEEGSHTQLLKKKNGLYARLWKHQSGGFLQED